MVAGGIVFKTFLISSWKSEVQSDTIVQYHILYNIYIYIVKKTGGVQSREKEEITRILL